MINFLPDTIKTFSDKSQQTVGSLIKSMKSDKAQIAELVKGLGNFTVGADYAPSLSKPRGIIESETFVDIFRDIQLRFSRYFEAANSVSTTANSMVDIMFSQISRIENNINYLESYINNYDFIAGKDDLYNYSYLENFDNVLRSNENEPEKVPYIDKGGSPFTENGNGYVDPVVSKFRIGNGINFINPIGLIKSVTTDSNYSYYVSSISDADKLFEQKQSAVWNVSVKSPTILTSLPGFLSKYIDYDYSYIIGAKTMVEIDLLKEIEMDVLRVSPNEFNGLQLMQVIIESANVAEKMYSGNSDISNSGYQIKKLLNSPMQIKSTVDITFTLDRVKKIILIFNQSTYTKSANSVSPDENSSRIINALVEEQRINKKNSFSKLQDMVLEFFRKSTSIDEAKRNSYSYDDYYTFKYPIEINQNEHRRSEKSDLIDIDGEGRSFHRNHLTNMVQNIVAQALGSSSHLFKNTMFIDSPDGRRGSSLYSMSNSPHSFKADSNSLEKESFEYDQLISGMNLLKDSSISNIDKNINLYQYSFSLRGIQFGKTNQISNSTNSFSTSKAAFISSRIPIPGNTLGIKAKINLDSTIDNKNTPVFDLKYPNSYELSVSLKEEPISENDWIAIVPFDSSEITSEILFIDPLSFTGELRFYPTETSIQVYCNQKLLNPINYVINKFKKSILIKDFNIKNNYVVSYTVDNVNFSQNYVDASLLNLQINTIGATDGNSAGEYFQSTNPGNSIRLSNDPYVDEKKLQSSTYSITNGTIATLNYSGYSPISIKLANGTYAINLTNYIKGSTQKANFYNSNEILFFQNGKDIIFNTQVNQPFRVMYNYLNNSLRFRLIVRNNYNNYFSSGSVDSVVIKMKTKNSNEPFNKLMQLG